MKNTNEKDVTYWRQQAEESERHQWCESCEKSYWSHYDECPHEDHAPGGVTDDDTVRCDEIHDGKLMFHVDADDPEHPLEKKAWMWGVPAEVER